MVDVDSSVPLYSQVKEDLLRRIQGGELPPGSRIPSEKELTKAYGVSTITIRRAVAELVEESTLERKQGKGTFVLRRSFKRSFKPLAVSFSEVCRNNNMRASARLIQGEIIHEAAADIFRQLELPVGSPLVCVKRLRYVDDQPIVIETCWFPLRYAYLLELDLDHESMYRTLQAREKDLRIIVKTGERIIRLVTADKEEAKLLNVRPGSALLSMESVCYDEASGRPIHASLHIGYAQKYNFAVLV